MKILIDIGHPAHVHFFKNFIWEMEKKGHEIIVTARDKECALNLLDYYKIRYIKRGAGRDGSIGKGFNLIKIDIKLYRLAKKFKPDVLMGVNNPYIAHTSTLIKKPSFIFNDTEHAKLCNLITYPFATKIITPSSYIGNLGEKQIKYNSYHELAYLHQNYFKPNRSVLKEVGVEKGENFFVLRFVGRKASHDTGHRGLSLEMKRKIVKEFCKYAKVFITSEGELSQDLEPYQIKIPPERMHDVLYYATLFVGESGTMST